MKFNYTILLLLLVAIQCRVKINTHLQPINVFKKAHRLKLLHKPQMVLIRPMPIMFSQSFFIPHRNGTNSTTHDQDEQIMRGRPIPLFGGARQGFNPFMELLGNVISNAMKQERNRNNTNNGTFNGTQAPFTETFETITFGENGTSSRVSLTKQTDANGTQTITNSADDMNGHQLALDQEAKELKKNEKFFEQIKQNNTNLGPMGFLSNLFGGI